MIFIFLDTRPIPFPVNEAGQQDLSRFLTEPLNYRAKILKFRDLANNELDFSRKSRTLFARSRNFRKSRKKQRDLSSFYSTIFNK